MTIRQLPTGVPGLDEILGGGLPEYSFNIIAGAPGCGKTTLAHQIMFANATPERPALYFTVLGEPAIKMLRYQQQFTFFDQSKMDGAIRFINLSQVVLDKDLARSSTRSSRRSRRPTRGIVVVDSFRTVVRKALTNASEMELQGFVQRLALHLTSWQATTFLIGEYVEGEIARQSGLHRGRRAVLALPEHRAQLDRAQDAGHEAARPGVRARPAHLPHHRRRPASLPAHLRPLRTNQITSRAGGVFPPASANSTRCWAAASPKATACCWPGLPDRASRCSARSSSPRACARASRGSWPSSRRYRPSTPSGPPCSASTSTRPRRTARSRSSTSGRWTSRSMRRCTKSSTRSSKIGCKRLVIDSLVGFEMALAPGFRTDFRESLYRMIAALTRLGVTIVSTVEVEENFTSMDLSNFTVSFLADDIVRLRYVSINGQLRKMLLVVKMRRSEHSIDMVEYQITSKGVVIGEPLRGLPRPDQRHPRAVVVRVGTTFRNCRTEAEGDNPNE